MYIFDVEGDGLHPTKLHCLSASGESGKVRSSTDYKDMVKFFTNADILIGHNIIRFDIPQVERLLKIKVKAKLVDTLALSWYLFPDRPRHGLAQWGEYFGVPKPVIDDWEGLSEEEYIHRCEEDVKITQMLWEKCWKYLKDLYGKDEDVWRLIDYLSFKMHCAMLQEKSGWKVDVKYASDNLEFMISTREEKLKELQMAMPSVPVMNYKSKPKKYLNKDDQVTVLGAAWDHLLLVRGLPPDYDGVVEVIKEYRPANPASHTQLKDWLFSLGWKPKTFKYKDGKEIPQINLENGKGICKSIKELFEDEPALIVLEGLSVLSHRIPLLQGILNSVDSDGRTKAQVQGFTNTLRFKHATIVNLPKVDREYGEAIRGSLIADEGKILCGSDQSSLEDRIKQHFIYKHDPDYVDSMNKPDFDPHLIIAMLAGMLTQEEVDEYKAGNKRNKPVRDIAKNGNYACQYGAHPPRLVLTCGIDLKAATALYNAYWKLNGAINEVVSEQVVKTVNEQLWLYNPVSKLYYTLRNTKDIFSTLVQGTASYVFDLWVEKILEVREQLTAQFHDEIVLEIDDGSQEKCSYLLNYCLDEVNDKLNLNRKLGIGIDYGYRYADIH